MEALCEITQAGWCASRFEVEIRKGLETLVVSGSSPDRVWAQVGALIERLDRAAARKAG